MRRTEKFKKIRVNNFIEKVVLIGLSMIFTILFHQWIVDDNNSMLKNIGVFNDVEMLIIVFGLIFVIEGIYFYSKPEIGELKFHKFIFVFVPYIVIFSFILHMHESTVDHKKIKDLNPYYLYSYLFFVVVSLIFEFAKFFKAIKNIFVEKVKESKDRLTIILTIVGTVISALALFK